MKKKFLLVCATFFCFFTIRLLSQQKDNEAAYLQLYNQAEILFNGTASDSTDSIALSYYATVANKLQPNATNANLLYNCYERMGILKQGLGFASQKILQDYYHALSLQKSYSLNDSILYRLLLSAGNVHYADGLFDSSVYYYSKAEKIINQYPAAGLAGDLYNSLGALYSESGDYLQSGNYFGKALQLTKQTRPDLKDAIFAMSANVASAVKLSGHPDSALILYKKILDPSHPSLAILNNISGIFLNKKQPDSALFYLQKNEGIIGTYAITTYNAFAQAYMLKNNTSSAAKYLNYAITLHQQNTSQLKNNYYGATCKYYGDLMMMEDKPDVALPYYQQAIVQYDYNFNNQNVLINPGNFIGDFASYNLFDALAAKANCFAKLYTKKQDATYFDATKNTYDSAFALADYIKKSIDDDEARSFIADKVLNVYITAVDFLITTNKNHTNAILGDALQWISKCRSASLAISLKENQIKKYSGLPDSLLQQEKNLKISISRLKLQLQQATDSAEQNNTLYSINTKALQLQSLNNEFKKFDRYYKEKYATDNIDIADIQANIIDHKTAVICYFKGFQSIHAFVITHNNIVEHELVNDSLLATNISAYRQGLSGGIAGKSYDENNEMYLYNVLVKPLVNDIADVESLVIIPDQDLINLPFEALRANDKYLVENYTISYQFALSFLQKSKAAYNPKDALAFAPFAGNNSNTTMAVLPSSLIEISGFTKQSQIVNSAATKSNFIATSGSASAIHLATHAVVNFDDPGNSYIAFYQQKNAPDTSYKLFAQELYNLQFPHTQFVFLSACETGSGKLSQSEGALSLSRAFAYAGCPNIITSLWKAEDKSTAYISEKFYNYLSKGYTYPHALQQAKKDLLQDVNMSQYHSPVYWSHLIFIGDVQQENSSTWLWITVAVFVVIIVVFLIYKKRKAAF